MLQRIFLNSSLESSLSVEDMAKERPMGESQKHQLLSQRQA
jgi:hypothetical protein